MRFAALMWLVAACGGESTSMMPDGSPHDAPSDGAPDSPPAPTRLIAYVSGYGPEITSYDFDLATGALSDARSTTAFAANPSFLAMTQTHLYAASEGGNAIGAYAIDQATGALAFINEASSGGSGPAHVAVDRTGGFVLAANYGSGDVAVLPVRGDGGMEPAVATPNAGANAHQILADAANRFVFVPCKGADHIAQYELLSTGALTPNGTVATANGAGPRHLAFAPNGDHAYLINELDSTLTVLAYDRTSGQLSPLQTLGTRAAGAGGANTGAEVVVHPNGSVVYASNRGDDTIAVFAIGGDGRVTVTGHVDTGATPRSFTLDPTGAWMLVANQGADTVATYRIGPSGMPTPMGAPLPAVNPSFVGFVALP